MQRTPKTLNSYALTECGTLLNSSNTCPPIKIAAAHNYLFMSVRMAHDLSCLNTFSTGTACLEQFSVYQDSFRMYFCIFVLYYVHKRAHSRIILRKYFLYNFLKVYIIHPISSSNLTTSILHVYQCNSYVIYKTIKHKNNGLRWRERKYKTEPKLVDFNV